MKKNKKKEEIMIPLTSTDLHVDKLKELIDNNVINEEIPFELIAKEYPSLLEEWYPGYPLEPRMMTPDDPIPALGYIKNGTITFKDMLGLENKQIPIGDKESLKLEGEYKVWLKNEGKNWEITVVANEKYEL